MTSHSLILFPFSVTLFLIKYYQLLLGFSDTSQTLSANTGVVSVCVANSCWYHGVVGRERLQGNVLIKEREVGPTISKQANAGRREEAPAALIRATRGEGGCQTGRIGRGVHGGLKTAAHLPDGSERFFGRQVRRGLCGAARTRSG